VIAFAAKNEQELVQARAQWEEKAGKVFDDDALYEERTTAFLEWFALERPLPDGKFPVEHFLQEEQLDDMENEWARSLARSQRSLFAVRDVKEGQIILDDLLGGGAFAVTERRRLPGVEPEEILEARLVANLATPPELLFTRAFQFHPREARVELQRIAERARKAGEPRADTLFRLLRLRLKAVRYRHVSPDKIYRDE
jgi:hypothetical protein